jgi:hypothetical protein
MDGCAQLFCSALPGCQGKNRFPEESLKKLLTACVCHWTHVEKLWKRCAAV